MTFTAHLLFVTESTSLNLLGDPSNLRHVTASQQGCPKVSKSAHLVMPDPQTRARSAWEEQLTDYHIANGAKAHPDTLSLAT